MTTPGANLAARRRRETKTCPICGRVFRALASARVCSSTCRSRLNREKNKPVTPPPPRPRGRPKKEPHQVEGNFWTVGRTEYPTIVEALEYNRVLKIKRSDAGFFIVTEGCDEYFDIALTPEQLTMLGRELIEMANEEPK